MNLATQTHLKSLRDALLLRLAQLRADVRADETARREDGGGDGRDRTDDAERLQAAEVADAEEERDVGELHRVEEALRRLDAGRYGDCADCGEPIGFERLFVQPAAERCVPCQAAHEARRRMRPAFSGA